DARPRACPRAVTRTVGARSWTLSILFYMMIHMNKLLIELDEETMKRLEAVAPARSRRRSEFVRAAIRKAIWEIEERNVADAYARSPDTGAPYLDARAWEPQAPPRRR